MGRNCIHWQTYESSLCFVRFASLILGEVLQKPTAEGWFASTGLIEPLGPTSHWDSEGSAQYFRWLDGLSCQCN